MFVSHSVGIRDRVRSYCAHLSGVWMQTVCQAHMYLVYLSLACLWRERHCLPACLRIVLHTSVPFLSVLPGSQRGSLLRFSGFLQNTAQSHARMGEDGAATNANKTAALFIAPAVDSQVQRFCSCLWLARRWDFGQKKKNKTKTFSNAAFESCK